MRLSLTGITHNIPKKNSPIYTPATILKENLICFAVIVRVRWKWSNELALIIKRLVILNECNTLIINITISTNNHTIDTRCSCCSQNRTKKSTTTYCNPYLIWFITELLDNKVTSVRKKTNINVAISSKIDVVNL